jgi:hypothetical protein
MKYKTTKAREIFILGGKVLSADLNSQQIAAAPNPSFLANSVKSFV